MTGRTISHYRILEKLGEGGMGVVYKARDTHLDRFVAIKVLPAEKVADLGRKRRFVQEAKAASALNHPNIITIYDIDQADGTDFIAMEYVAGQTLDQLIGPKGMKPDAALKLAVQTADALAKAHAAGIVHRDLKPQNVMVTADGLVKLLDFGLAKLTERSESDEFGATQTLGARTEEGTVVGTVAYMSPEQAQGLKVDARSDIFSFGALLYEMVTGRRAFQGQTKLSILAAVLHHEPSPVEGVSPELERLILRCLCKEAARRAQHMADVKLALEDLTEGLAPRRPAPVAVPRRGFLMAAGLLVLAVAVWWISLGRSRPIDSLAVLPFVNAGGDPNAEYLSEGISESLITGLSRVPRLKVKSRDTAFRYKGQDKDVQVIGRELGVRAVLKGRLVERGGSLAITAELVDTSDGTLLWRDQYNRKIGDILTIEAEISREISDKLRWKLTGEEQKRLAKRSTGNAEAHQLYLKGRYAWDRRSEENLKKSMEYFQQATEKDPSYALAWAGLADSYNMLAAWGVLPRGATYPLAKAAAAKALELDGGLAEALATLARVKTEYEWDWTGAERMYKQAIELNPNWGTAHQTYAVHLAAVGRPQEAVVEALRAREAEPLSPVINANVGWFYYVAHQYDRAEKECRKVIEMEPSYAWGHNCLGSVYLQTGRHKEAVAELQQSLTLSQRSVMELTYLGHAYAVSGAPAEAQKLLDELQGLSRRRYVPPEYAAVIYGGLGERDRAFEWFEKAYAERSMHAWFLPDPRLDPLRSDPRFQDLMRRMGLPL